MADHNKEHQNLIVELVNDVAVVGFGDAMILDAYHVQQVTDALYALIEKQGHSRLVIDLATIRMLSSQTLGVLLNMRQKLEPLNGRMVIAGIDPKLYRVFKVTSLDHIFDFYPTRDDAVKSFL
jgi:anti-sigma B factor antagonist